METYISFYLKTYRIHVFVDSLRRIGNPNRICFMISEDGNSLMVTPYPKKDFRSHSVPSKTYQGEGGIEISSYKLCQLIAKMQNWDAGRSYRVPGTVYKEKQVAVFDLSKAEAVKK